MSQKRLAHAIVCAIALSLMAAEPAAEAKLPASVAADLKSVADMCREVGGKPIITAAVKSADLNGDGKADFVLDVGSVNCENAASVYGDREKGVTVYAGDRAGGAVSAFSDVVYGVKIEGSGAAAKLWLTVSGGGCGKPLWLTVSGGGCGKPPAPDFASENFCDRALQWNAKARKFDYAPVSTVRMIE